MSLPPEHPLMQALNPNPQADLAKLHQLGAILRQLGHPAFQGPHLPGLPPHMQAPTA